MSYYKLIDGIKAELENDSRIKTITEGDFDDLDQYKQNVPALAHIICEFGTIEENLNTYDVELYALDIVVENNNHVIERFKGNDNSQEVFHEMDNVLRRFYMRYRNKAEGLSSFIVNPPTMTKILEQTTDNRLAGWQLNFTVGVPNEKIDGCEII